MAECSRRTHRPSLALLLMIIVASAYKVTGTGFQHVTCGSVLKLANTESNIRLHSHEVKYGSGSGQQSVTGAKFVDDVNSYWVVKGAHGETCNRGTPVKCGSVVRLEHLQTRMLLHSHHFRSPLSGNQEVSCFGDGAIGGDTGDNWIVECSQQVWSRDDPIRLKHADTKVYLHASGQTFGRPINGQVEICGVKDKSGGNLWKAMEGVYMEPLEKKNNL